MTRERLEFEREEIAAMARDGGARRETKDGVSFWHFPPWLCPHCVPIGGRETEALPDCPQKLARHGPVPGFDWGKWDRREAQ